jgi:hypothetical protein
MPPSDPLIVVGKKLELKEDKQRNRTDDGADLRDQFCPSSDDLRLGRR